MITTKDMPQQDKVKTIQSVLLPMFDDIIKVFDENNIWYSLSAGTLLGAVREKGFIPWDDDIDIDIKYSQMEMIVKLLRRHLPDYYDVQFIDKDKGTSILFPRVLDKRWKMTKVKSNVTGNVYIDLFAITQVTTRIKPKFLITYDHLLFARNNIYLPTIVKILKSPLKLIPVNSLVNAVKKRMAKISNDEGEYILWTNRDVNKANRVISLETENIIFENREVKAYKNREIFLEDHYGEDFMTPPNKDTIPTMKYDIYQVE